MSSGAQVRQLSSAQNSGPACSLFIYLFIHVFILYFDVPGAGPHRCKAGRRGRDRWDGKEGSLGEFALIRSGGPEAPAAPGPNQTERSDGQRGANARVGASLRRLDGCYHVVVFQAVG